MLTLNEATIRFGGLTAVDHVSFTVEKGQIFGVIGPNGAGKTTLFNLVSGVHKLTSGSITFNGKDVGGLEPYQIAEAGIARTYQNINLFSNLTVLENAMIGRHTKSKSGLAAAIFRTPAQKREEAAIREKCMELLQFMGLEHKADLLAKNLSYGEQRRLEIARAMASEPQLLLLDEPAAGMNSTEKVELTEMIRKIRDTGITILLVEHDMKLVMKITDRIAVLNFGELIALDEPQAVQNDPAVIAAYLGGGIDV
ncbi:MAG: ABC transporter ATP-binding protein [Clostridiales bacterium]|nr:ABC transporter ATP-binding protein [Clostridiales bacterium]